MTPEELDKLLYEYLVHDPKKSYENHILEYHRNCEYFLITERLEILSQFLKKYDVIEKF